MEEEKKEGTHRCARDVGKGGQETGKEMKGKEKIKELIGTAIQNRINYTRE